MHEVVKGADVVPRCFLTGAAERNKVDEATLKQLNPDLIYLSAPGYGVDGSYSTRAAYVPSIGAAALGVGTSLLLGILARARG